MRDPGSAVVQAGPLSVLGELALLFDTPQRGVLYAGHHGCTVWGLHKQRFRSLLASTAAAKLKDTRRALKKAPLLQRLTKEQLHKLADAVREVSFKGGDVIIRKGDIGDALFFLTEGLVKCTDIGTGGRQTRDIILEPGKVFGERALLLDEARAANVVAVSSVVTCYTLDRRSVRATAWGSAWGYCMDHSPLRSPSPPPSPYQLTILTPHPSPPTLSSCAVSSAEWLGSGLRACACAVSYRGADCWCGQRLLPPQVHQLLGPLRDLFTHNMAVNVLRSVPMLACLSYTERNEVWNGAGGGKVE